MDAFKLGNLHDGGLDQEKTRTYYEKLFTSFRDKCSKCWARHLCGGQCPWQLSNNQGEVERPRDDMCRNIKRGFELRLGLYAQTKDLRPRAPQAG